MITIKIMFLSYLRFIGLRNDEKYMDARKFVVFLRCISSFRVLPPVINGGQRSQFLRQMEK